ncbi:MAG TPA: hypothetical protein PKX00_03490 [Opitutaceae bacterium]|nr:hypothetical protein [Opitutaceae bacterium]
MSKTSGQRVLRLKNGVLDEMWLPAPHAQVVPGVRWGRFDCLFSPAFWVSRTWIDAPRPQNYRLTLTLEHEVIACLLGGYGMPAELGLAAFSRLQSKGLLVATTTAARIESELAEPLSVGPRWVRYRYPRQRARYVAMALRRLSAENAPTDALHLRDWLLSFDGIGLKTASWITRNVRDCDEVAILDIHLERAGKLMGVFSRKETPARHYLMMERKLVDFAEALDIRLSILDDIIWRYMKALNYTALQCAALRR